MLPVPQIRRDLLEEGKDQPRIMLNRAEQNQAGHQAHDHLDRKLVPGSDADTVLVSDLLFGVVQKT